MNLGIRRRVGESVSTQEAWQGRYARLYDLLEVLHAELLLVSPQELHGHVGGVKSVPTMVASKVSLGDETTGRREGETHQSGALTVKRCMSSSIFFVRRLTADLGAPSLPERNSPA